MGCPYEEVGKEGIILELARKHVSAVQHLRPSAYWTWLAYIQLPQMGSFEGNFYRYLLYIHTSGF
ncbi:MAG: hypothetical protein COX51_06555 [Syntrophobacteraceae bacterium CG23_combo_of_CG06-09_8_20_14_all_50_8]|nr:MAG: hypothetical protein COX51_06555 [Syntrophobacteraceae bacterium CG23_combo_of_CG06-09_8_20_14_all_50_8]